ncbi:MAG TPA: response regulator transcription factor, partial [Acidimicrobiales bacterium]|nr:response regulator transcription factor [Acidimicrobiales bacterium]
MTFPMDVSDQGQNYGENLRTVDSNPTTVFTPVGDVQNDRTILVAEDDNNTRRALQHYLKRSGYEVTEAASVDESLEAVFTHPADLVILDFDIGGGTAEVLTKIRRRSSVPIIVCSGRSSERDRVGLLNLGADDVLSKPYSFAELEARMRAVLR